jgi:hypothetical protein
MAYKESTTSPPGLSLAARRLLGIVLYYVVAGVAFALIWEYWRDARQLLSETLLRGLADEDGGGAGALLRDGLAGNPSVAVLGSPGRQARSTLLVLAGVLLASLPVAWTYSLTRRRRGFAQSMVHILILLPVAVAGMVVLIQNNLALAFSLAGIVAVLRFRNTIDDVKDGVYVFIAVSIGISAAVGALTIGIVTSIVFNACVLLLWWLDFARRPTPGIRGGWRKLARLPKVVPPAEAVEGAAPDDRAARRVVASAARAWRRQLELTAEHSALPAERRYNASLRILTSAPDLSRPLIEELLQVHARRWALTGVMPGEGGTATLKYRVFVRRSARDDLLDAVRGAPQTVGVELR